jgi:hypothetical protein
MSSARTASAVAPAATRTRSAASSACVRAVENCWSSGRSRTERLRRAASRWNSAWRCRLRAAPQSKIGTLSVTAAEAPRSRDGLMRSSSMPARTE